MIRRMMPLSWVTLVVVLFWVCLPAPVQAQADEPWIVTFGDELSDEEASGVARDLAGNAYVVGVFQGAVDFDPGPGERVLVSPGSRAGFVAKLNPAGDLLWAHGIGGGEGAQARGVAVDAAGNCYITGEFKGLADFDPGPNKADRESKGDEDIFLLKLDTNGNFLWAVATGNKHGSDVGEAVVVDRDNNVYITGSFEGLVDFDPTKDGSTLAESEGEDDIFLVRYKSGGDVVWAKGLGGNADDVGTNLAVDPAGNIYVTGEFEGTADFDPGWTSTEFGSKGDEDIFVAKFAPGGDARWARVFGGQSKEKDPDVAVDSGGNVYLTGGFQGRAFFRPGDDQYYLDSRGEEDFFLAKFDTNGGYLWSFGRGSARTDRGEGIVVDGLGSVMVVGSFEQIVDFDPGPADVSLTSQGADDVSITKYNRDGALLLARSFGTVVDEEARDLAVDVRGSPIVVGDLETGIAMHDVVVAKFAASVWRSATNWVNLPLVNR